LTENTRQDGDLLTILFRHNTWANLALLDFCQALAPEQLEWSVPGTFGSVRDTLLHIVSAEVGYVNRVTGGLPGPPPAEGWSPAPQELKHDAAWCGEEFLKLAFEATPERTVTRKRGERMSRYPLAGLLVQTIHHSTEHRTQVATTLSQRGIEPPDMSVWEYMTQHGLLHVWMEETASD
jgi:uncharacterized damage-inducible protein DinB